MSDAIEPRVAVVGATGAVGSQIVELIAARAFPHSELKLFASSAGGTLEAGDDDYLVDQFSEPAELAGFDVAFLATPEATALEIVHANPGPILIDASGCARGADPGLLAPGLIAREHLERVADRRLHVVPSPAAQALALCLKALGPGVTIAATILQGASARGRAAITRTVTQTTDLLAARLALEEDEVQRAFNAFNREHERAIADRIAEQTAAMLSLERDTLSVQLIAIPVLHGTIIAVHARQPAAGWMDALRAAPGILMTEEPDALEMIDAVGQEAIVTHAEAHGDSAEILCAFDNARLAALGALWIAETFALKASAGN